MRLEPIGRPGMQYDSKAAWLRPYGERRRWIWFGKQREGVKSLILSIIGRHDSRVGVFIIVAILAYLGMGWDGYVKFPYPPPARTGAP